MRHLLCAVAVLFASYAAYAQSAPPIKMGLWETTDIATITGMQLPPDVVEKLKAMGRPIPGSEPHTTVIQGCLTPERWRENFAKAQQNQDCHMKNLKEDSSGMSADIDCKSEHGASTGHIQMTYDSTEKVQGTVHMEMTSERNPQPIVIDMKLSSVYQGPDCKGVSPDSAKVVH